MAMQKILIITGRYLPGFRDGGPVRSILNLTDWMGDDHDIRIMCLDRDHGDDKPYPGITVDSFNEVKKARVWYTAKFTSEAVSKLANDSDVVYCCGPYDDYAMIVMRLKKEGKIPAPVYIASMGSFSPEAFKIKGYKKRLFITYMKLTGMFRDITWSVTSGREESELKAVIGNGARCVIATDLPRRGTFEHTHIKDEGCLKLCFISRISRKKNLMAIPDILKKVDPGVHILLDVYGNCEDEEYMRECSQKLDRLVKDRPNIRWEYKGEVDSEMVPSVFADHDAFLFPTLGENYGHVIAESLAAGCIPVISDTTPWIDLEEKGCGYVLALSDTDGFTGAIVSLSAMTEAEISMIRSRCYTYIEDVNKRSVEGSGYRKIFG